jgi:hypothetical protein
MFDVARECRMAKVFALAVAAHAAIAEVRQALKSAVDDTQAKLASETQDIGHQVGRSAAHACRLSIPAGMVPLLAGRMLRCQVCHARCTARVECSCTE